MRRVLPSRRGRAAVLAVAALTVLLVGVLVAAYWMATTVAGPSSPLDGGAAIARPALSGDDEAEVAAATDRGQARFAPIRDAAGPDGASEAPGLGEGAEGVTAELPPLGVLRFEGVVMDYDQQPLSIDGGSVRVFESSYDGSGAMLIGVAPVSSAGTFRLDITRYADRSRFDDGDPWICGQLVAPGFEPSEGGGNLSDFSGGVLRVNLQTAPAGGLATGLVVDTLGRPVRGARVRGVQWGELGVDLVDEEVVTDSTGHYGFVLQRSGWIDVLGFHAAHGVAKGGGRLVPPHKAIELETLVLEPRAVIAGRVLGFDSHPLPGIQVAVEPVEADVDYLEMTTGADGTFRFATIERVPYRLTYDPSEIDWDDQPILLPDAEQVVVRLPYASVTATVLGPDARTVQPDMFSCGAVDADGRRNPNGARGWVREERLPDGRFALLFESPGRYSVAALAASGESTWTVTRAFTIGKEHLDLELTLEPRQERPIDVVVLGPDGKSIPAWNIRFVEVESGMTVSHAQGSAPRASLAPGVYRAHVTPEGPTYALPFQREVEVAPLGETQGALTFKTESEGGRLVLSLRRTDESTANMTCRIRPKAGGSEGGRSKRLRPGASPVDSGHVLVAGPYELVLARPASNGMKAAKKVVPVQVEAGATRTAAIVFP